MTTYARGQSRDLWIEMNSDTTNTGSEPKRASLSPSLRLLLAVVIIVGFGARLGFAVKQGLSTAPESKTDAEEYDTYAWNVVQGNGYRGMSPDVADRNHLTAYRPPGPSLLMAGIYSVVGHRYDAVRVVHCLLGAASIGLVFCIGRRLFGASTGLISAAIYSLFPLAVLQSTEIASEPLGVFLFLAFIDAALVLTERPTYLRGAVAGLIFGAALLTRANFVLMFPMILIWSVWQFRWTTTLLRAALIPAVAIACLIPWAARNYQVFGELVPFSTMGGSVLLQGNNSIVISNPKLYGYNVWDTEIPEYREALKSAGTEVERDRRAKRFAIEWLKDNPDKWGFLVWHKFIRSWTPFLSNNPSAAHRMIYLASWGPVLLLFILALIPTLYLSLRYRHPVFLIHLAILHYVANSLIFFAYIRYRAPIDPLCIILAATVVTQMLYALGWRRMGQPFAVETTVFRPPGVLAKPASGVLLKAH
jgi:4-amino-4-deoxy-L-arabinose transferase-like glycosyltransferase